MSTQLRNVCWDYFIVFNVHLYQKADQYKFKHFVRYCVQDHLQTCKYIYQCTCVNMYVYSTFASLWLWPCPPTLISVYIYRTCAHVHVRLCCNACTLFYVSHSSTSLYCVHCFTHRQVCTQWTCTYTRIGMYNVCVSIVLSIYLCVVFCMLIVPDRQCLDLHTHTHTYVCARSSYVRRTYVYSLLLCVCLGVC